MTNVGSYAYDAANRMKAAPGVTNDYDGDGRRVKHANGAGTLFYLWSSVLGLPVVEVTSGGVYRAYVYGPGGGPALAMQSYDLQFYWVHTDHLGSGRKLTNASGAVAYRGEFDPHGQALYEWHAGGGSYLNSHKFTGYERDWATNLDDAKARTYHHNRGRFMQPDPLELGAADFTDPQSLNRYTYTGNDPINFVDPSGLDDRPALSHYFFPSEYLPRQRQNDRFGFNGSGSDNTSIEVEADPLDLNLAGGGTDQPQMTPGQKRHCEYLAGLISQLIDGVQKGATWVKGLAQRAEQQAGAPATNGPGTEIWDNHKTHIDGRRRRLENALKSWEKSNCGPPPPGAKELLDKSLNTNLEAEWHRRQNPAQQNRKPDFNPVPIPIPPRLPWWKDIFQPRMPIFILTPVWCRMNPHACRPPQTG